MRSKQNNGSVLGSDTRARSISLGNEISYSLEKTFCFQQAPRSFKTNETCLRIYLTLS